MTGGIDWVVEAPARPRLPVRGEAGFFPVHRVYCVGSNYPKHVREMGGSEREPPFFFSKPADAVCSADTVPFPGLTANLHHEVELVAALGRGGAGIGIADALGLVYGYAVGVDLTRRDLQAEAKRRGRPWTTAKGFDRSAPLSPIQPVPAAGHPVDAAISLRVNGDLRQRGNISEMTWSAAEIISGLSRYFELKAGDLIFTGTPSGVGALQPGDRVECVIETVGSLDFRMGPPDGPLSQALE
jgi:fumarylpyruvate hydrolase